MHEQGVSWVDGQVQRLLRLLVSWVCGSACLVAWRNRMVCLCHFRSVGRSVFRRCSAAPILACAICVSATSACRSQPKNAAALAKAGPQAPPIASSGQATYPVDARVGETLCERVLATERSQISSAYARTVAEFKKARREKRDLASQHVARLERAIESAARDGKRPTELSIELANAREDAARGAPPKETFFESLRCYALRDEAWLLHVARPTLKILADGTSRDWSLEGDYELAHVDHGAIVGHYRFSGPSDEPLQTLLKEPPLLVELNSDKHIDILWVVWLHPETRTVAFTYRNQQVTETFDVPVPGVPRSVEVEQDGRRGRISYAVALDSGDKCLGDAEIEHDPTHYSFELLAEVSEGKILLDTPLIREKIATLCRTQQSSPFSTADEVLCARFHGVSSESLLREIDRLFVEAPCEPDAGTPHGRRVPTSEFVAMRKASQWQPPFAIR